MKNLWIASPRAIQHGGLGLSPTWMGSWIRAAVLASYTLNARKWKKLFMEDLPNPLSNKGEKGVKKRGSRAQNFVLSVPGWVMGSPTALSAGQVCPTSSVHPRVLCKDHHFLWLRLKLGESAVFRCRGLWTQVSFQGCMPQRDFWLTNIPSLTPVSLFGHCRDVAYNGKALRNQWIHSLSSSIPVSLSSSFSNVNPS